MPLRPSRRAETIAYDDYVTAGGYNGAKEKGLLRSEGKEYVVQEVSLLLLLIYRPRFFSSFADPASTPHLQSVPLRMAQVTQTRHRLFKSDDCSHGGKGRLWPAVQSELLETRTGACAGRRPRPLCCSARWRSRGGQALAASRCCCAPPAGGQPHGPLALRPLAAVSACSAWPLGWCRGMSCSSASTSERSGLE